MELGIVKKVMAFLALGEAGKIGHFFERQKKNCDKAIRDLKRNKETLENEYKDTIEDYTDKIEDAKEALENSYKNVTVEDVKTNADSLSFEIRYWNNVDKCRKVLKSLEVNKESFIEDYEKAIEEIDQQIDLYNERIAALVAE